MSNEGLDPSLIGVELVFSSETSMQLTVALYLQIGDLAIFRANQLALTQETAKLFLDN